MAVGDVAHGADGIAPGQPTWRMVHMSCASHATHRPRRPTPLNFRYHPRTRSMVMSRMSWSPGSTGRLARRRYRRSKRCYFLVGHLAHGVERQQAALRPGPAPQNQHAGHDRAAGEMPVKYGSLKVTFLMAGCCCAQAPPVHQQERIAVGQLLEDCGGYPSSGFRFSIAFVVPVPVLMRSRARQLPQAWRRFFPLAIFIDGKHAGVPPGWLMERVTVVAAEMCTWSASVSAQDDTAAPTVQCAPIFALATPEQPAMAACADRCARCGQSGSGCRA